jgi:hypothetical protein
LVGEGKLGGVCGRLGATYKPWSALARGFAHGFASMSSAFDIEGLCHLAAQVSEFWYRFWWVTVVQSVVATALL